MKHLLIITLFLVSCTETNTPKEIVESKLGGYEAPLVNNAVNSTELEDTSDWETKEIQTNSSSYSYTIINNESGLGYGYQIHQDGMMLINQKHIPSIPGVNRFETKLKSNDFSRLHNETG